MTCFSSLAKHRIDIYRYVNTDDVWGGQTKVETFYKTVWAILEPRNLQEITKEGRILSRISMKIIIRYIADMQKTNTGSQYIIKYRGRIYDIQSIICKERIDSKNEGKNYLEIYCYED